MQSRWQDAEAEQFLARYAAHGPDIALRVYTSRLIGRDDDLVMHGGGNTSVKTTVADFLGEPIDVLCVKGSGWDLVDIEPAGLPAVELEPLRRLRALDSLSDEDMVAQVRRRLLDPSAPNPSVEALLHAYLPHKFVDHTHADAILIVGNQADGAARIRDALGDEVEILPWVMPGFPLAKAVANAYEARPSCTGIVLLGHGIFTFADDARASYEKMVELVDRAERFAARHAPRASFAPDVAADAEARRFAARILPNVRGRLAIPSANSPHRSARRVLRFRTAPDLRAISSRDDCAALLATAPLTPDHVLRTKGPYLCVDPATTLDPSLLEAAVGDYVTAYRGYYDANQRADTRMLDPRPVVVLVRGVGLIASGADAKAADIAADIAEHTLRGKAQAADLGGYVALTPEQLFEMEYWSLEQAKLGKGKPAALAGRVALVTGAAGAIGHGIADALLAAGAHVCLSDFDADGLARVAELLRARHPSTRLCTARADVTESAEVEAAFDACVLEFGGVDIVVPNAGIAHVGRLSDMDIDRFRQVVDVNLTGTLTVLRAAARVFEAQRTGGAVVLQASKNVFAPGESFGAYSASKAGAHQLGKIAALEFASLGVRVNMINADAVFGSEVDSKLWRAVGPDRMRARGLDEAGLREFYRERSLLKVSVTPEDVGAAVVFFAGDAASATTGATLPVDAGIAGAFPR